MQQFDSLTTRMPNGVTNAAPWQTMGAAGIGDPTWAQLYANDFNTYTAAEWTSTVTGTGSAAAIASDGGAIRITNSTGNTDSVFMQLLNAGFKVTAGKNLFFKFAGKMSAITNTQFYCGLIATSTTPLSANDGIYVYKASGGTLQLVVKAGGSTIGSVNLPAVEAIVAATYFEIGIMVDQQGNVAAFFNPTTGSNPISAAQAASSQARGRVATILNSSLTAALPTALLNVSFGLANVTTGAANTLDIDYIVAARER